MMGDLEAAGLLADQPSVDQQHDTAEIQNGEQRLTMMIALSGYGFNLVFPVWHRSSSPGWVDKDTQSSCHGKTASFRVF